MQLRFIPAILGLCTLPLVAQFGNGGNGDLETSPLSVDATFTLTVTGAPGQAFGIFMADNPGPTVIPGFGTVSLDLFSPSFLQLWSGVISPTGSDSLSLFIPNDPFFLALVVYLQGYVVDPGHPTGLALTRGLRIDFESPDSFLPLPALSAPRALATGDAMNDGRVLVAGGGNGSLLGPVATPTTEIYQPFSRTWSAGPTLSQERAFHASAKLNDGRILLCGGTTTTGAVTNTCDIYDPATNTISPAATMALPRAGFAATTLLDGRVLVTGGTTTFVAGGTPTAPLLGPILNGSQNTGEVYNPATNTWAPCGNVMGSKRFIHTQTRMADGKVFCVAGINGSQSIFGQDAPTFTATTSIYDPATNLFAAGGSITTARAGHRATLMGTGEIFVGGGVFSSIATLFVPTATNDCRKCTSNGITWSAAGTMPVSLALQGQVLLKNGKCHLSGGGTGTLTAFSATNVCATRVAGGASFTTTTAMPDARGFHLAVLMQDGSILISGGGDSVGAAVGTNLLYMPAP